MSAQSVCDMYNNLYKQWFAQERGADPEKAGSRGALVADDHTGNRACSGGEDIQRSVSFCSPYTKPFAFKTLRKAGNISSDDCTFHIVYFILCILMKLPAFANIWLAYARIC